MRNLLSLLLLICVEYSWGTSPVNPRARSNGGDSIPDTYNNQYILHVKRRTDDIRIDGVIDEPDWLKADKAKDFRLVLPIDSGFASSKSEVEMTYDDKAFYVGATFFDTIPGRRIMESFRRDFVFSNNDNLLVFFDTFLDRTNGFTFGNSASGAKWDGTMYDGAASNLIWDCKWDSKVKHYDDRWVIEMRIPFRSIRFRSGGKYWLVNFSRLDLKTNQKSSWAPMPRQFPTSSLAYAGVLEWEDPLPKSKMMFSVIPYVFGSVSRNFEAGADTRYRKDFGLDAKIGVSTSMNLDLTYNPDFSQAEVDQQVTNLDRFELFFPEKRQFFLENSDLFSGYGFRSVTPFFSRRIGLDAPVLVGARLSGKLDKNWRLGLMDMQTERTSSQLGRNFMVVSLQRKVFARSNIGMIFVNKEYLDESGASNFNRIVGADYNLASSNNIWKGKLFYHQSFMPDSHGKDYAQGASLSYNTRHVYLSMAEASVGKNYRAETGYVPRAGYNLLNPEFRYLWLPNKQVVSHGITYEGSYYFDPSYNRIDHEVELGYVIEFSDRSTFSTGMKDYFVNLLSDFDPTHSSQSVLSAGNEYNYQLGFVEYHSDTRKMLNWYSLAASGEFYSGNIKFVEGKVSYRYQPYLNMAVNFSYNDINLPSPFERTRFWLVGPKFDFTFTENVFFSTYVQYNEQIDNMNVNMRFQWRYKPVSDLFIVFTDNYFPGSWNSRNRALVVKLSYWFN